MTTRVQHALKVWRSAVGDSDKANAEEELWLALSEWKDAEVVKALKRCQTIASSLSAGNVVDALQDVINQADQP